MQNSKIAIVLSAFSAVTARTLPALHVVDVARWEDLDSQVHANEDAGIDEGSATYGHGSLTPQGSVSGFMNQGGPKLTSPKLYAQFYGSTWTTSNTSIFETFFANIGAHAYLAKSREMGAGTLSYTKGTNRRIINGGTSTTDLDTQSEIFAIVNAQVGAYGETINSQNHYALIPNQTKSMAMKNSPTSAFAVQWCGYHSSQTKNSVNYTFSVNGYSNNTVCAWFTAVFPDGVTRSSWNGNQLDYVFAVLAHEIQESLTDPWYFNRGWYDLTSGISENGDKCNGYMGGVNVSGALYYNLTIGTSNFAVQTHLDHTANTCPRQVWP